MTNSTAVKRTKVSSWKHLIDVPLNFAFQYEKKSLRGGGSSNKRILIDSFILYDIVDGFK